MKQQRKRHLISSNGSLIVMLHDTGGRYWKVRLQFGIMVCNSCVSVCLSVHLSVCLIAMPALKGNVSVNVTSQGQIYFKDLKINWLLRWGTGLKIIFFLTSTYTQRDPNDKRERG